MRSNLHCYILFLILSIQAFAPTFHLWREQYPNGAPKYYGAGNLSAVGSGSELKQDTQPRPQINSTNLPIALTKALLLNFTDAISKFYPNGSYKNTLELPDIDSKNFAGCRRWPQIGQRTHVQVVEGSPRRRVRASCRFGFMIPLMASMIIALIGCHRDGIC